MFGKKEEQTFVWQRAHFIMPHIFNGQISFAKIAEEFLYYCQFGRPAPVTRQTYETYQKSLDRLSAFFGNMDIRAVTVEHIAELKKMLLLRGSSPGYIYKILGIIRALLRFAREEKKLEVLAPTEIKLPARIRRDIEYLTIPEVERLVSAVETHTIHGVRAMALVSTLLDTGMRISEALSLNRGSIDFESRRAYVVGKGNKKRMVLFRDWSIGWIKKYLELRTDTDEALFLTHNPGYPAVRYSPDDVRRSFRALARKTGIAKLTPHALRRTAATTLWVNGQDMRTVQLFLGHSNIKITESYVGIDYEHLQELHRQHLTYGNVEDKPMPVMLRWARAYERCISCGQTDRPHCAKGMCDRCYMRDKRGLTGQPSTAILST